VVQKMAAPTKIFSFSTIISKKKKQRVTRIAERFPQEPGLLQVKEQDGVLLRYCRGKLPLCSSNPSYIRKNIYLPVRWSSD